MPARETKEDQKEHSQQHWNPQSSEAKPDNGQAVKSQSPTTPEGGLGSQVKTETLEDPTTTPAEGPRTQEAIVAPLKTTEPTHTRLKPERPDQLKWREDKQKAQRTTARQPSNSPSQRTVPEQTGLTEADTVEGNSPKERTQNQKTPPEDKEAGQGRKEKPMEHRMAQPHKIAQTYPILRKQRAGRGRREPMPRRKRAEQSKPGPLTMNQ
ncbi:hypothetical protein NDU88_002109 [Pleurodeles waltl]|uniref:Uncharacterized protein n=1 Tax=Pleurodeles waltl TaxID=8319 RepID=A0AAV7NHM9_PLEWA|nr:hypothetical protein NDU88_002109 [Pleurodeles waltl]